MFLSPFGRTIASRTFVLLIYLSATCLVFASGLANILASKLSGVLLNCSPPRERPLNKKSPKYHFLLHISKKITTFAAKSNLHNIIGVC